ncbi:MAG: NAD(P)/FAD-dependent oxidoreductase [Candidatus Eremiobacteraeota bacterium]|nr:NAD(P)/FAD-dependent oxidoreductase [Candidatus Eremiobacteraeota bacterium]
MYHVAVVGAGPAGVNAAMRAAGLGARTALITSGEFGGMAANDGTVPVRTLAHAARLARDARSLSRYGIAVGEPKLDYTRLLARAAEVIADVRAHSAWYDDVKRLGITLHERAGKVRFVDAHTLESETGTRLEAAKIIICTGGVSRRLDVPGFELTATPRDALSLRAVPESMLVIGAGATGAQVASIFNAFGARIQLFQTAARIIPTEDEEISAAVAAAFRQAGILIHESFGEIESFEKTPDGVRMSYVKDNVRQGATAALVVVAVGWVADSTALNLAAPGVATNARGYVQVDEHLRTSVEHVFAAGDVTGRLMLVPQAIQDGYVAGTNAVRGPAMPLGDEASPIGSFTDPEYAQVGLTEAKASAAHDVAVVKVSFDTTTRTIIDGVTTGFCKLVVDRRTGRILGCHVVGERAVEIAQVVAVAMTAGMTVDDLARIPLSFPTYAAIIGRAAYRAARELGHDIGWTRVP